LRIEVLWTVLTIAGVIAGVLIMVFGLRKREQVPTEFDSVDGILKQDWSRTGNVDFHVSAPGSTSPQLLVLRVEERKTIENALGQDVVQLRWRLATLEEAKEVVVCWNRAKAAERDDEPTMTTSTVLSLARRADEN
jgi:hypothetical protein